MLLGMMLGGGRTRLAVTLASNGVEFVLSSHAVAVGWNLGTPVELTITVNPGIERQSTSTAYGGLHLDGLHPGSLVNVINSGYLLGRGGAGGAGGPGGSAGGDGVGGGAGIRADFDGLLVITNGSGYIWGGGGGGAGGAGDDKSFDEGGGGGGGAGGGAGGTAGGSSGSTAGTAGTTGRFGTFGVAGAPFGSGSTAGANGGAYGAMGGFASNGPLYAAGNPGAGGYAVRHNSGTVVSWVSGSTRVAGSVGWYL